MIYLGLTALFLAQLRAQSIRLDELGEDRQWFQYKGMLRAGAVIYEGTAMRQAFTYLLQGSLNITLGELYQIPLSFSYSQQKFQTPNPFRFNRFSLNPSYKWVSLHLGDAVMNYSPYTLGGHRFTGVGIDLAPVEKWKFSAMYGRLLEGVSPTKVQPGVFERKGYAMMGQYADAGNEIKITYFHAWDVTEPHYRQEAYIDRAKSNKAISLLAATRVLKNIDLQLEYGVSALRRMESLMVTQSDRNDSIAERQGVSYFKALNSRISYALDKGAVALAYERVDPEYESLGAYYFNNDLENITLNFSRQLFGDRLRFSGSAGLQRDNLKDQKSSRMNRLVSAVNTSFTISDKLSLTAGYSNFKAYTNLRKPEEYAGQASRFESLDTLNYYQISQNGQVSINRLWTDKAKHAHNLSYQFSMQSSANQQQGRNIENGEASFYNHSIAYGITYPEVAVSAGLTGNLTIDRSQIGGGTVYGPAFHAAKRFLKTINSRLSLAWNHTRRSTQSGSNISLCWSNDWTYRERHQISLNLSSLFRRSAVVQNDITLALNYAYSFDNLKLPSVDLPPTARETSATETPEIRIVYRGLLFEGLLPDVSLQLTVLRDSTVFRELSFSRLSSVNLKLALVKEQKERESYRIRALDYLDELFGYLDFREAYEGWYLDAISRIVEAMPRTDRVLESRFVNSRSDLNLVSKELQPEEQTALLRYQEARLRLVAHRWLESEIGGLSDVKDFRKQQLLFEFFRLAEPEILEMVSNDVDSGKIISYLETSLIDHFYRWFRTAKDFPDPVLRYHKLTH
ncbi:hypothetical protein [Robertkochia aurantiaca]|uniref:hypothetical protein n=1 Tax=Robertkochia aurantiaca TaxID=2873700 RepID=UPI001CCD0C23|nr:hypothetical protein [Robertkochia sp. 3YJGBD-33]